MRQLLMNCPSKVELNFNFRVFCKAKEVYEIS